MITLDVYFIYVEFFTVRRWLKIYSDEKWWLCCHNDFLEFKVLAWIHKIHIMCCWQFIVSKFSFIKILNCSRYSMRSFCSRFIYFILSQSLNDFDTMLFRCVLSERSCLNSNVFGNFWKLKCCDGLDWFEYSLVNIL